MGVAGKSRNLLLPGIGLCIVSILLLIVGALESQSQNGDFSFPYLLVPFLFLLTGVVAVVTAKNAAKR